MFLIRRTRTRPPGSGGRARQAFARVAGLRQSLIVDTSPGPATVTEAGVAGTAEIVPRAAIHKIAPLLRLASHVAARPMWAVTLQATLMWLATRIGIAAVTYFAVTLSSPVSSGPFGPHALLWRWDRLDVNWYLMISKYGYWRPSPLTYPRDMGQMPTAFFPLYPILIRAATTVVGEAHRFAAAVVISNLGTLLGFIGVGLLAAREEGEQGPIRTLRVLAAYPLAFFLAAAYTEGIFLALAAFCLYFARQGAWARAIACAFLAGLTRFTCIVLFLPLIVEFASQNGWLRRAAWVSGRWRDQLTPRTAGKLLAIVVLPPLGLLTYMAYLSRRFGDPLSFAHAAQANWYHTSMLPWNSLLFALHGARATPAGTSTQAMLLLDFGPVAVFAVLTLLSLKRIPLSFSVYMLGLLLVSTSSPVTWSTDVWVSAGRYLIPSIPLFLLIGRWAQRWPLLDFLVVSGGFAVQTTLVVLWVTTNAYIT